MTNRYNCSRCGAEREGSKLWVPSRICNNKHKWMKMREPMIKTADDGTCICCSHPINNEKPYTIWYHLANGCQVKEVKNGKIDK